MDNEYRLDFSIPAGPTGPSGLSSTCFINYTTATQAGTMQIQTSKIFPINSDNYEITSDSVIIKESGIYEITFCGKIDKNTSNKAITVTLGNQNGENFEPFPGMYGKWNDGTQMIDFSQTNVYQFDSSQTLKVSVSIQASTNFSVSYTNLIFKKLSI